MPVYISSDKKVHAYIASYEKYVSEKYVSGSSRSLIRWIESPNLSKAPSKMSQYT